MRRVVSGGQTGVDRAALDAAMEFGLSVGGWCPKDRLAEDGVIPVRYPLHETGSEDPAERTLRNVHDSDGTLVLLRGEAHGGTLLTIETAQAFGKPLCVVDLESERNPAQRVSQWLRRERIEVLNVAGPRESESPGIYEAARTLVSHLLVATRQRPRR